MKTNFISQFISVKRSAYIITAIMTALFFYVCTSGAEETYKFERMWPVLRQPWYFSGPIGITKDSNDFVYIADSWNNRIQKFTSDGKFVTKWGKEGKRDGEFGFPVDIASDNRGFIYIADAHNCRIQKFTSDGKFITKWGNKGNGNGEFLAVQGIAVDNKGFIYVVDTYSTELSGSSDRVQKFTEDGNFIATWGHLGIENGEFEEPIDITIDSKGFVYVADNGNNRIQKFTSYGEFVTKWGKKGRGDGEFMNIESITTDANDFVYVTDIGNDCVQKFTSDGEFVAKWGEKEGFTALRGIFADDDGFLYATSSSSIQKFKTDGQFITEWGSNNIEEGNFFHPEGITFDSKGFIYIVDSLNNLIQKFTADGQFVTKWGDGQFYTPTGITTDVNDFIYVIDAKTGFIQKFTQDGKFENKWDDKYWWDSWPVAIAVDKDGFMYVVDEYYCFVEKFNSKGESVAEWGTWGSGDGEFYNPFGIAIDSKGFIYVADTGNNRIQKFTPDGKFVSKWGTEGNGNGEFNNPLGITVDKNDFVYVSDVLNNRIQKFSSDGKFITAFGEFGSESGQLNSPSFLCLNKDGKIYVSDRDNNRIQVFRQGLPTDKTMKAVIVAGKSSEKNSLWDATQVCTNFAYHTLTYQGFTKQTIYYLTSDKELDLDNNLKPDDVDGDVTNANLKYAITEWAKDADSLVVYLTDHGGTGNFLMNEKQEYLNASDLDSWLDSVQETVPEVIVVYDACHSGSFLPSLTPPEGKKRIVITSTNPNQDAQFYTQGTISFSNYFWTHIFNGINVGDAFDLAKKAISYTSSIYYSQTPLLDDTGDGEYKENEDGNLAKDVYIGNGTKISGNAPEIKEISPDQTINDGNSATLYASGITDDDGIAEVWAVIRPPEYKMSDYTQESEGKSILKFPSVPLMPSENGQYKGTYNGFNTPGIYHILFYANDRIGNTSIPKLSAVTVKNPLMRKAVIVAGCPQSDELWYAIEKNVKLACKSLYGQSYSDDGIYLMTPASIPGVTKTPVLPTLDNLEDAITRWGKEKTLDLVLYMTGYGGTEVFKMNDYENLSPTDLDSWLDELQDSITGKVTFIYDVCKSGSFIPFLIPPEGKERIVITSTREDEPADFLSQGDVSFSQYFWSNVLNGENVKTCFDNAQSSFLELDRIQEPQLDDNGNGIANEGKSKDGKLAETYTIGFGIMLAGVNPSVVSVSPPQTLNGEKSANIWADAVSLGTTDKVWAIITPPYKVEKPVGCLVENFPEITLVYNPDTKLYEGDYDRFLAYGEYKIAVYAKDKERNISLPMTTSVFQNADLIRGDINGDEKIDLTDAVILLKALAGINVTIRSDYAESGAM